MGKLVARNFLRIIAVGNSEGIILPKKILNDLGVKKDNYVMVTVEKLEVKELNKRLRELKKEVS